MAYTKTSPIPPVRYDVTGYEAVPGVALLYDDSLYADKTIRLPVDLVEYLTLLDGERNAEDLAHQAALAGRPFSIDDFLNIVNALDQEYFLDSPRFHRHKEKMDRAFSESTVRPMAHAGASYPNDPEKLRRMLDGFLATTGDVPPKDAPPIAVIAPHIDFRVGGETYGPAYNALRRSDADTFVVFGVSHQMSYDSFMISSKDFQTPLGTLPTDREFIEHFRAALPFELTRDETAHRREHSIEFQAVFLRHIFPDRDIRIVPILTGSLWEYVEMAKGNAADDARLNTLYEQLAETARELGRKVCYIAGADLCHIGRKFGDDFPARSILGDVEKFDTAVLDHAARPDPEGFIRTLAGNRNKYRICGVAPIYATLRTARPSVGEVLCYRQWDEVERESAVTFASVAYY